MTDHRLDALLRRWATSDARSDAGVDAALARILRHVDTLSLSGTTAAATAGRHRWWWFGGLAAVAASVVVVALTGPAPHGPGSALFEGDSAVLLADADLDDGPLFASLFTPTNDEEYQL